MGIFLGFDVILEKPPPQGRSCEQIHQFIISSLHALLVLSKHPTYFFSLLKNVSGRTMMVQQVSVSVTMTCLQDTNTQVLIAFEAYITHKSLLSDHLSWRTKVLKGKAMSSSDPQSLAGTSLCLYQYNYRIFSSEMEKKIAQGKPQQAFSLLVQTAQMFFFVENCMEQSTLCNAAK